jgi:hypothetical protein
MFDRVRDLCIGRGYNFNGPISVRCNWPKASYVPIFPQCYVFDRGIVGFPEVTQFAFGLRSTLFWCMFVSITR